MLQGPMPKDSRFNRESFHGPFCSPTGRSDAPMNACLWTSPVAASFYFFVVTVSSSFWSVSRSSRMDSF